MSTSPSYASFAVVLLFSFVVANKANTNVLCDSILSPRSDVHTWFFFFDSYKE